MNQDRANRGYLLLHRVADRMEEELRGVFTGAVLDSMDCDALRYEYGCWIAEDDYLVRRYDKIIALIEAGA